MSCLRVLHCTSVVFLAAVLSGNCFAITHKIKGHVQCKVPDGPSTQLIDVPHVRVRIDNGAGQEGDTDTSGLFQADVTLTTPEATMRLVYSSSITFPPNVSTPLQVMDDGHQTRSDSQSVRGTVTGDTLDLGIVQFESIDCELWRIGVKLLDDYHALMGESPPPKKLRLKRWAGVVVGTPHTDYDYITVPTDFMTSTESPFVTSRECTLFHEFGHDIWFTLDGDEQHWRNDLMSYGYARSHSGNELTNVHYAWSEGWADYWRGADSNPDPMKRRRNCRRDVSAEITDSFIDWNEWRVAAALTGISDQIGPKAMIGVLKANPGRIHSLHEFVVAAQAMHASLVNLPATPSDCPFGFVDDGATCRRDSVAKPSVTRGAGVVPSRCDANLDRSGALCYPRCPSGFVGNGPVCWQVCPAGFTDDGATCRRDLKIVSADNSSCPLYDKCGLTFSKGCSKCPEGFSNDGCTCRIDLKIVGKQSSGRGAGSPMSCATWQKKEAGLCYSACPAGFSPAGPVCWGRCPAGTRDDGATCFQPTLVLIK
ncbi:MAG: hypothetical protein WA637_26145 [Terriglobales bacterium]